MTEDNVRHRKRVIRRLPDVVTNNNMMKNSFSIINNQQQQQQSILYGRKKSDGLMCSICEGPAHGYNFDAITCESCKAFFRRNALKTTVY
jgi:hypothetical protein